MSRLIWLFFKSDYKAELMYSFSIRTQIGQTPNCGLRSLSSKFCVGQSLQLEEECQTDPPFILLESWRGADINLRNRWKKSIAMKLFYSDDEEHYNNCA